MSTIYVLEPPTKGKVVVNTTHGPIDRCYGQRKRLNPYGTSFNYVSKVTSITPSSTVLFPDFSFKAAIPPAPAPVEKVYMEADKSDWLDKKHTIFGKVTGDSIYNLLRLGEVDTDIVPIVLAKTSQEPVDEVKESQKKPVKKLNLLSFGEEAEEEEKELAVVKEKIKGSHDVLNDPRHLKAEAAIKERNAPESKEVLSVRETLSSKKEAAQKDKSMSDDDNDDDDDEDETKFDVQR